MASLVSHAKPHTRHSAASEAKSAESVRDPAQSLRDSQDDGTIEVKGARLDG